MKKNASRALAAIISAVMAVSMATPISLAAKEAGNGTNATYYNNATIAAADPHVSYDSESGYYYAYSTDGANKGYNYGVYRSPDLVTWEKASNGALSTTDPNRWGKTWFWAPEVYHNKETGLYFFFYSAMMKNEDVEANFGYADFGEACKIGVAVSENPEGPFRNISNKPMDYHPYDPDYYDVNLLMDSKQMKPPETLEEGMTAPKGTYIPTIDANVFFDDDGRMFLYYSRNAYRNWVWDEDLGKYIEESNIYAVELNTDWWNDPTGSTMPTVKDSYINATKGQGDGETVRKDGFVPIINYGGEKQTWENAHVNDYTKYNGAKKDRRWAEGSSTMKYYFDKDGDGEKEPIYYIMYSCNNFENENYGVGYAVSDNPLGPWDKYDMNPILQQDPQKSIYSTGHGSFVSTPDETETYYVYHGRSSTTTGRKMYSDRMYIDETKLDANGLPVLWIDESTDDRPVPTGVAPYVIKADTAKAKLDLDSNKTIAVRTSVANQAGAEFNFSNVLNRVSAVITDPSIATVTINKGVASISAVKGGKTSLTLTYQRKSADDTYYDVKNGDTPVSITIPVEVSPLKTDTLDYVVELAQEIAADPGNFEDVIQSVKDNFDAALANAVALLEDAASAAPTATQAQIDNATYALINAMHYLEFKGDKSNLEQVISLASKMEANLSKYLDKGKDHFVAQLAEARRVMADPDALNDEITTTWKNLLSAVGDMRLKPSKEALEALKSQALAIDQSQYTANSVAVLNAALTEATEVLANDQATPEEVDEAQAVLQNAMDGLVAKNVPAPGAQDTNTTLPTGTNGAGSSNNVKTGDSASVLSLVLVAGLSGLAVLGLGRKKRK